MKNERLADLRIMVDSNRFDVYELAIFFGISVSDANDLYHGYAEMTDDQYHAVLVELDEAEEKMSWQKGT